MHKEHFSYLHVSSGPKCSLKSYTCIHSAQRCVKKIIYDLEIGKYF